MLMAFPFFANRPFIAPLNLNGLRCFCKPQCVIGPPWKKPRKWSAKGPLPEAALEVGFRGTPEMHACAASAESNPNNPNQAL
jgi:hypothetical protein